MLRWLTGSVSGADWPTIRMLAGLLLVLLPIMVWLARSLRITELGDDVAAGLGVTAAAYRRAAAARRRPDRASRSRPPGRSRSSRSWPGRSPGRSTAAGPLCVGAGLVGAIVVVAGDYVADYLLADINFPVGVVTGAFGAPFLLWLLARGRTGRRAA